MGLGQTRFWPAGEPRVQNTRAPEPLTFTGQQRSWNPSTEQGRPGMLPPLLPVLLLLLRKDGWTKGWMFSAPPIGFLLPRFLQNRTDTQPGGGVRLGRTEGNVILKCNGCPIPPPFPLCLSLLLSATPHQPSSPGPLSLSLSLSSIGCFHGSDT